jgi:hypothetical protein
MIGFECRVARKGAHHDGAVGAVVVKVRAGNRAWTTIAAVSAKPRSLTMEFRRADKEDPQDPEQRHHVEPVEPRSEDIPGRSFAGASFAADEEEQTEDERRGGSAGDDREPATPAEEEEIDREVSG